MSKVTGLLAAGLICVLAGVGWSYVQRGPAAVAPEKLLPEGSVLFVRCDGALQHMAGFEKTAAHDALYKSGLMDVLQNALKNLSGQAPDAAPITEALKFVQDHGVSVGATVETEGAPAVWGVIVLHDAAKYKQLLDQFAEKAPGQLELEKNEHRGREITHGVIPDSPAQFGWWAEKGHLVVAVGINAVDGAIDVAEGERPNVTGHRYWETYAAADPAFEMTQLGWFDMQALREMFGGFPVPAPGATPDAPISVLDVLSAVGLENLNGVVGRSGYDGRALVSEQIVDAPGKHHGLLGLADQPAMTLADLPAVPPTHSGLTAVSFDGSNAYTEIVTMTERVLAIVQPEVADQIRPILGQVDEELEVQLKKELFDALGNVHCLYLDSSQGAFGLGSIGAVSVRNPAALRRTLRKLLGRLQIESNGEIQIRDIDRQGRELLVVSIPKFPLITPTISVDDDWMAIGLNSQAVEAFLLRQDGKLPKWEPSGETAAALKGLPQEFTSLSIIDPRDGYRFILGSAPMLVGLMELGMKENGTVPPDFVMPFDVSTLPPAEVVTSPLFPNVSVAKSSDDGFVMVSRSSLPGVPLASGNLGGSTGIATTATLVALLLPAVQQARSAARRAQSKNNLKQLALALHNYHDVFNQFPSADHPNNMLDLEERLSWLVSILPYVEEAPLYNQMDMEAAWDSETNDPLLVNSILPYLNPNLAETFTDDGYAATHYVGVGGLGEKGPNLRPNEQGAGMFAYGKPRRMAEIIDGTSNTMMVAEVNAELPAWGRAKGSIRPFIEQPYINGPDGFGGSGEGLNVAMGDGSVRFISEEIDPLVLEALVTIAGGEAVQDF